MIVGAPYDGPDHRGAIYVYLGSKVRLTLGSWKYAQVRRRRRRFGLDHMSDPSQPASQQPLFPLFSCLFQVIYGKDLDPGIRTFGWSLSAGMDLDGNEYPDVLVGAYDSGHAVFFRSAPVVHLDAKVRPYVVYKDLKDPELKMSGCKGNINKMVSITMTYTHNTQVEARIANKQVDLEQKRCTLRDGTRVACMEVDVSMKYHGVRVPDSIGKKLSDLFKFVLF